MSDELIDKLSGLIRRKQWYELPRNLATARLGEMRTVMRLKNLHDTEEPALERVDVPANLDPSLHDSRTIDGTSNDLHYPNMGAVGRRFGPIPRICSRPARDW